MKEEANGQIALASSKDAGLAMKYAHSLVKLTDPRAILYALGENCLALLQRNILHNACKISLPVLTISPALLTIFLLHYRKEIPRASG